MIKTIVLIFLLVNFLWANMYNFTEIRYSDAIGHSMKIDGQIEFLEDGLNIFYPKTSNSLRYKNGVLKYMDELEEIDLDHKQKQQIKSYFDILILLHNNNDEQLNEFFEVKQNLAYITLKPKNNLKKYITKIELFKPNNILKSVKLFLKNNDNITININDEIH